MDTGGSLIVSDIDINKELFDKTYAEDFYKRIHEDYLDYENRCRWNPTIPVLAITFDERYLQLIDAEKMTDLCADPLLLDEKSNKSFY